MADVFISHVEEDETVATILAEGLSQAGYSTWLYERDILPGASYLVQTGKAIDACRAFLVLITPRSVISNQVGAEVVRAFEENKPFVPLRLEVSHAELQRRQPAWRQAIGSSASISVQSANLDTAIRRVIDGLRLLEIQPTRHEKLPVQRDDAPLPDSTNWQVFISAKHTHSELVNDLEDYLRTSSISAFSSRSLQVGKEFGRQIDQALDQAHCLVVLGKVPDDFLTSWVQYEWMCFHNEILSGRKSRASIIPLLLDGSPSELPLPLRMMHVIMVDTSNPVKSFATLRDRIKLQIAEGS